MFKKLNIFSFAIILLMCLFSSCENAQKANSAFSEAVDRFKQINWAEDVVPQFKESYSSSSSNGEYKNLLDEKSKSNDKCVTKQYAGFILSFNTSTHTPQWVAWQLLGQETDGTTQRSNKFWQDENIEGCPTPDDYKHSGYDKGHLCPAADNKMSEQTMHDCFVMANMCPQAPELNQKAWATLEKKCRLWAQRDSAIYIVAGPIYNKADNATIGKTKVKVPSAFYKVIIAPYLTSPRGIAFVYPNMASPGNMQNYSTTIREVEKITGLDFFYSLPDSLENIIETSASFKEWNR